MLCLSRINYSKLVGERDVSVKRQMKVIDEFTPYLSPAGYLAYGGDVSGQSAVVPVVVMPAAGASTSAAVVYVGPPGTYRQWVPPTTAAGGPLVAAGVGSAVNVWPQLTHSAVASNISDRAHATDWATSGIPAVPYQPSTVPPSINNQYLLPQSTGVPSSAQQRHDTVIPSLNPSDKSFDNPLVVSTK